MCKNDSIVKVNSIKNLEFDTHTFVSVLVDSMKVKSKCTMSVLIVLAYQQKKVNFEFLAKFIFLVYRSYSSISKTNKQTNKNTWILRKEEGA